MTVTPDQNLLHHNLQVIKSETELHAKLLKMLLDQLKTELVKLEESVRSMENFSTQVMSLSDLEGYNATFTTNS